MQKLSIYLKAIIWRVSPSVYRLLKSRIRGQVFSIGVLKCDAIDSEIDTDLNHLPTLTRGDVDDVPAEFVADPFIQKVNGEFQMFFEILNSLTHLGQIGLATSVDGTQWHYQKTVLQEPFHLAYPQVFVDNDTHYMIPDSPHMGVRLYKASGYPSEWQFVKTLFCEGHFADSSIFFFEQRWWMFTAWVSEKSEEKQLRLFYCDHFLGDWTEHPCSPMADVKQHLTRPGGRVQLIDGVPVRYTQDGSKSYGESVNACQIKILTTTEYAEEELAHSILKKGKQQWRSGGMHHIDALKHKEGWLVALDGWYYAD